MASGHIMQPSGVVRLRFLHPEFCQIQSGLTGAASAGDHPGRYSVFTFTATAVLFLTYLQRDAEPSDRRDERVCAESGRRFYSECQLWQSAWSLTRTAAWRQNNGHVPVRPLRTVLVRKSHLCFGGKVRD